MKDSDEIIWKEILQKSLETCSFYISVDSDSKTITCDVGIFDLEIPEDQKLILTPKQVVPIMSQIIEEYAKNKQKKLSTEYKDRFPETQDEIYLLRDVFFKEYHEQDCSKLCNQILEKLIN